MEKLLKRYYKKRQMQAAINKNIISPYYYSPRKLTLASWLDISTHLTKWLKWRKYEVWESLGEQMDSHVMG